MLDYGSLSWNHEGLAFWRHVREVPCTGPPGFTRCEGSWNDAFGGAHWCSACSYGNGRKSVVKLIRVPQYDVQKRPRKGWKPAKRLIDKAFA